MQPITSTRASAQASARLRRFGFKPGETGNPGGRLSNGKRYRELFDAMAAEFGDLTAVDRTLLGQACNLLVKSERTKDPDSAVRLTNASARLLMNLRKARAKHDPAYVPMREKLAAASKGR
jgi:hypothetical protein